MREVTSASNLITDRISPSTGGLKGLKAGDVVAAIVLASSENGEVLLGLKGEKIGARAAMPLLPGESVSLKVEDTSGTLTFKLVGREAPVSGQILELIKNRLPSRDSLAGQYSDLLSSGRQLLRNLPALQNGALGVFVARLESAWPVEGASGPQLRAFIEDSGLFLEQRIAAAIQGEKGLPAADLKALLIAAMKEVAEERGSQPSISGEMVKFLEVSDKFLNNMELTQLLGSLKDPAGQQFYAVFPYGNQERSAHVEWEGPRQSGDISAENASFVLSFDLQGMGKLRIDGLLASGTLHCHFWAREESIAGFIKDNLVDFSRAASERGVHLGDMACGVAIDTSEAFAGRSLAASGMRLLDRKI